MAEKEAVTEVLTYWEQLGLEKGREEGRREGREEGRQEAYKGMRKLSLAIIEARFGPMPAEDSRLLDQLSLNALEKLGLSVAHVSSYAELQRVLREEILAATASQALE